MRRAVVAIAAAQERRDGTEQFERMGPEPSESRPSRSRLELIAPVLMVVAVLAIAIALGDSAHGHAPPCEVIRYSVLGAPPPVLISELETATAELQRKTGIRFVADAPDVATLVIRWSAEPLPRRDAFVRGDGARRVASARGSWRSIGGRMTLASGTVVIDGTWPWLPGIDTADSLGTALLHELGHVIGLDHSDEPDSFMYAQTSSVARRWTERDHTRLADIARMTGCSPPATVSADEA